ncbi:MAG: hypothetical protein OIF54_16245, partial [Cohaesibacter sp.]|nr:hypothetical protein [Cohaesibacter sp.]
ERGEGASDAVVQGWLAKALTAPRGPQWVCENCHDIQPEWAPVCQNCGSFDTLSWQTPQTPEIATATGVHMLPLIVGALEDQTSPSEEPEQEAPAEVIELNADTVDETVEKQA